jgi:hypothetical protein
MRLKDRKHYLLQKLAMIRRLASRLVIEAYWLLRYIWARAF